MNDGADRQAGSREHLHLAMLDGSDGCKERKGSDNSIQALAHLHTPLCLQRKLITGT
jgi:hypothetical protein